MGPSIKEQPASGEYGSVAIVNAAGAELWIQWLVSETDDGPLATAWTAALDAAKRPNFWWMNDGTHAMGLFSLPAGGHVLLPYFGVSVRVAPSPGCDPQRARHAASELQPWTASRRAAGLLSSRTTHACVLGAVQLGQARLRRGPSARRLVCLVARRLVGNALYPAGGHRRAYAPRSASPAACRLAVASGARLSSPPR